MKALEKMLEGKNNLLNQLKRTTNLSLSLLTKRANINHRWMLNKTCKSREDRFIQYAIIEAITSGRPEDEG